jgi:hypothetical protein
MNCTTPYLVHWHLRKHAGTVVRDALKPLSTYVEAHCNMACLTRMERKVPSSECWQRLVILREPYSQLLSEMDHFPFDFLPSSGDERQLLNIDDNHMVCQRPAMMGLCSMEGKRAGSCNADAVLGVLETFNFIGFFEHLDNTLDALVQWLECSFAASSSTSTSTQASRLGAPSPLGQMRLRLARQRDSFRRGCWAGGCRTRAEMVNNSLVEQRTLTAHSNATARLRSRHQSLRDNRTRTAAAWVLERAPNRSAFEAHQACAIRVYQEALRRWGPEGTGGPTGRASHCEHAH